MKIIFLIFFENFFRKYSRADKIKEKLVFATKFRKNRKNVEDVEVDIKG